MLCSFQEHKYSYCSFYVITLSKPEHMVLYKLITQFLALRVEDEFEEGMEILYPRLLARETFDATGGWSKYRGHDDAKDVDKILKRFQDRTQELFDKNATEVQEIHHHELARLLKYGWKR